EREDRVLVPDLRGRVGRIVARDAPERGDRPAQAVRRHLADRLDAELDSRLFARSMLVTKRQRRTFCRLSFFPFSVAKTRSLGALPGRRSSQTASSSRSAGVRSTTRVPASKCSRRIRLRARARLRMSGRTLTPLQLPDGRNTRGAPA